LRAKTLGIVALTLLAVMTSPVLGLAQKQYDAGVTDAEIKIGNIMR
jgi:hypothetical protein